MKDHNGVDFTLSPMPPNVCRDWSVLDKLFISSGKILDLSTDLSSRRFISIEEAEGESWAPQ